MVLAIDPGPVQSAYVFIMNKDYKPVEFDIVPNAKAIAAIMSGEYNMFSIECMASYGKILSTSIFETCYWIGRFMQKAADTGFPINRIYRKDVKLNLCGCTNAKDKNVNAALKERFGEVGTKKVPGFFYGFKADIWAAYAVGVTFLDMQNGLYKPKEACL
jgi:hypothetical protein